VAIVTPTPGHPSRSHDEEGLIAGRPAEDRSFELVEVVAGAATGLAIGSAVAGPVGTVVGGIVGAAAGLIAGEAVERAAGPAATTTDASEQHEEV
jgi:outer membrane lipoprotein SlyB